LGKLLSGKAWQVGAYYDVDIMTDTFGHTHYLSALVYTDPPIVGDGFYLFCPDGSLTVIGQTQHNHLGQNGGGLWDTGLNNVYYLVLSSSYGGGHILSVIRVGENGILFSSGIADSYGGAFGPGRPPRQTWPTHTRQSYYLLVPYKNDGRKPNVSRRLGS
jgi:hypothetical protein